MKRTLHWQIEKVHEGMSIEQFLRTHGCSHHVLTHLKRTECGILLNGAWAYTNQKVKESDTLEIRIVEEEPSSSIAPVRLPLDIVYEDEDLLIVNKSGDMPIHPSMGNHGNTLANGVMWYYASQGIPFVYRCINRLDRETSGLLIIAKNMYSASILSRMSSGRLIHREYLSIAEGRLPGHGTIDAPIARAAESAIMRCVDYENGDPAVTHYESLRTMTQKTAAGERILTLAAVRLETGRTHQIRVHMKHIGHPLIGDFLYNPGSTELIGRQALHSFRLSFCHPVTRQPLTFSCEPPDDMLRVISERPTLSL